jgi:hypothetical protein
MTRRNQPGDFFERVKIGEPSECWEWQGPRDASGYGRVWYQGRRWRAHRLMWTLSGLLLADGLVICHRCDNPPCVNLEHLFLGTYADNAHDRDRKGRQRAASGLAHGRYTKPERSARGERNGQSKLTPDAVADIRARYRPGLGAALAREYGVSKTAVQYVLSGETWR